MSYTLKATSDIVPSIKQHLWTSVEPSHPLIKTGSLSVVEFYFCFNSCKLGGGPSSHHRKCAQHVLYAYDQHKRIKISRHLFRYGIRKGCRRKAY